MEDYAMRPERRPKASMAKTVIICVVFGLLAFVFALISEVVLCVRNTLMEAALSDAVSGINPVDMELGMFMSDEDIDRFAEDWYLPKNRINEDSTIGDMVCESAAQYGLSINSTDLEDLLEESDIMPAIGSLVGTYEQYFLTGEDEEMFSRKALFSEIKKHRNEIEEYTGVDISLFYNDIEQTLRENSRDLDKLNPSELTNDAGGYTSKALSIPVIIVFFALSLVMAVIALIITLRPVACVRMYGIVLTVTGGIAAAFALLLPAILDLALTMLRPSAIRYISGLLKGSIVPIFAKIGAIFAGAGIILIIASIISEVIIKKINAKRTEPAANV